MKPDWCESFATCLKTSKKHEVQSAMPFNLLSCQMLSSIHAETGLPLAPAVSICSTRGKEIMFKINNWRDNRRVSNTHGEHHDVPYIVFYTREVCQICRARNKTAIVSLIAQRCTLSVVPKSTNSCKHQAPSPDPISSSIIPASSPIVDEDAGMIPEARHVRLVRPDV